jgi:subtilisin family serine protease
MTYRVTFFFIIMLVGLSGPWFVSETMASGQESFDRPSPMPRGIALRAVAQIQALQEEKALRTKGQRKIDSGILYAQKPLQKGPLRDRIPALRPSLRAAADGRILVDVKGTVTPSLLERIGELGGKVVRSFSPYHAIRARIPLEQVENLAEHPHVRFIRPAARAFTNKGNTSEGDRAHNAALARQILGVDGSGIRVGVLSDSVDHLADVQAQGDLPQVTVLEDVAGLSGEGTALLEIVHDLAPGAALYFATAWTGMEGFASNILALRDAGCHLLVDDVTYLLESPFQDDLISQAVNEVTADGILYFSSAGNSGNLNNGQSGVWEGDFSGVSDNALPDGLNTMDVHDFGQGHTTNAILRDPPYAITLFWADPLGASENDYDLYLLSPEGDQIWAASTNFQDGDDDPWEAIDSGSWNDKENLLVVSRYDGADRFIHLNTNRGRLEHATAGQIKGHHAAAGALCVTAVGAQRRHIPFDGTESVETFVSDGPRRVFYEADGTPITPGDFSSTGGELRRKPDMAAADGVATVTPWFAPFYGTSAAAAHGAGIGALLLSARPHLLLSDARTALTGSALDIEEPGWDRDSGWGVLMADRALSYDDLFVTPLEGLRSSGPKGGPFAPTTKVYLIENTTDKPLWWRVTKTKDWLDLSTAPTGMLPPGETKRITVSLTRNAQVLGQGFHEDWVSFLDITRGSVLHGYVTFTRKVRLRIGQGTVVPAAMLLLFEE